MRYFDTDITYRPPEDLEPLDEEPPFLVEEYVEADLDYVEEFVRAEPEGEDPSRSLDVVDAPPSMTGDALMDGEIAAEAQSGT